jgi:hypothetical protein
MYSMVLRRFDVASMSSKVDASARYGTGSPATQHAEDTGSKLRDVRLYAFGQEMGSV